jgi:chemotaxis protein CheD
MSHAASLLERTAAGPFALFGERPAFDRDLFSVVGLIAPQPAALPQVYLKPGELMFTHEPAQVTTVLGSCVAVTMFHPRLRFAAICHGMLPEPKHDLEDEEERFKYLSEAIPFMAARFRFLGLAPHEIEVKMFGGGNVLGFDDSDQAKKLVGSANVDTARQMLFRESMAVKAGSVEGDCGRKIVFNTQTGEVLHKFL